MNLNGDEKRIRQLFRELSREDERRAPGFAGVVEAARSRTASSQPRSRALAYAAAVIFIAILIAASFAVRHPKSQTKIAQEEPVQSPRQTAGAATDTSPAPIRETVGANAYRATPKRVRRRRRSDELAIHMKSLSAWQSPTASLLKVPGEEMFKSLPRLGEYLQSIKIFSPDEFN